jgi:hypothetical protein
MNAIETFPAPELGARSSELTKWEREYEAFLRLLPELLPKYRGEYVAVHDGRVVGHGPDKVAVALAAYRQFGSVEILVRLVSDEPPDIVQIPSPRRVSESG